MVCYYYLKFRIKITCLVYDEIKHFFYGNFIGTFLYLPIILEVFFWRKIYLCWLVYHNETRNRSIHLNEMFM